MATKINEQQIVNVFSSAIEYAYANDFALAIEHDIAEQFMKDNDLKSPIYRLMITRETREYEGMDSEGAKIFGATLDNFMKSIHKASYARALKNGRALARVSIALETNPTTGLRQPIFGQRGLAFEVALDRWYFGSIGDNGVTLEGMKQAKGFAKFRFEVSGELVENEGKSAQTWYHVHNLDSNPYISEKELSAIVRAYIQSVNTNTKQTTADIEKQRENVTGYAEYMNSKAK